MDLPEPLYARIVELGRVRAQIDENCGNGSAGRPARFRARHAARHRQRRAARLYVELIARRTAMQNCANGAEALGPVRPRRRRRTARALRRGGPEAQLTSSTFAPIPPRRSRADLCLKRCAKIRHPAPCSGLLGQIGDPRAVEPLRELLGSADLATLPIGKSASRSRARGGRRPRTRFYRGSRLRSAAQPLTRRDFRKERGHVLFAVRQKGA